MFKAYFLWLLKLLTIIAMIVLIPVFIAGVVSSVGTSFEQATGTAPNHYRVGVVEIKGIILDSKKALKDLYEFADDTSISGIVLRVDSPGGAVGPSQEIYGAIQKIKEKKPIVASMGSLAASGGLYVSLPASKILAQPGTLTGSIGVIIQVPNYTDIAQKVGFEMITVKSGKYKDMGNPFRHFTEEDQSLFQGTIDEVYKSFRQCVIDSRKLKPEDVDKFADGRVIVGSNALELGLIDGYGDIYDAAKEIFAIQNKKIAPGKRPELVYREDKFERLAKIFQRVDSLIDFSPKSLTLQTPQAYFLMN